MPINTKKIIIKIARSEAVKEILSKLHGFAHPGTIPGTIVIDVTSDDTQKIYDYLTEQSLPPVFEKEFGKYHDIGQTTAPTDTFESETPTEALSTVDTDENNIVGMIINWVSEGIVEVFGV